MNYEWYPGHMTRAMRTMKEDLPLVDLVIEMADARIPGASRNPDIDSLCGGKLRLLVLAKADLSDKDGLDEWVDIYRDRGISTLALNCKEPGARSALVREMDTITAAKRERDRARGIINRPIRALVAGIPNVGKSTLINLIAKKSAARTGNKPGVTRGKQWIQAGKGIQLLDSPGVLWPKTGDADAGELLAMIGSMNDDKLDETELASALIRRLSDGYRERIADRYGIGLDDRQCDADQILVMIARARGFIGDGGVPVVSGAARAVIDDFRKGRLGSILLERPGVDRQQ